jgi:hypothetical protein
LQPDFSEMELGLLKGEEIKINRPSGFPGVF